MLPQATIFLPKDNAATNFVRPANGTGSASASTYSSPRPQSARAPQPIKIFL
jgi:hypothetical protein